VAAAYQWIGPKVFGKRPDGTLAWWSVVALLPFLLFTWLLWRLQRRFSGSDCCNEVAPGIWLGRRAYGWELPAGISLVVDLTAEFPEPKDVRAGRSYRCLPTLDTRAPEERAFQQLVEEIVAWPGSVYIHCAAGHGRSATVAAAALIARGLAQEVTQAEHLLKQARPGVSLNSVQRGLLERVMGKR
jgi:protein-tyrosine phosphatase